MRRIELFGHTYNEQAGLAALQKVIDSLRDICSDRPVGSVNLSHGEFTKTSLGIHPSCSRKHSLLTLPPQPITSSQKALFAKYYCQLDTLHQTS